MSGRLFYNRASGPKPLSRRSFLLQAGLLTGGIYLSGCIRKISGGKPEYAHVKGKLSGPNAKAGHALRDKLPMPAPSSQQSVKTLIIGSGISGLSAARWLKKQGETDFKVLELEDHTGGNASFGTNSVSSYPLGAHYLPIVNNYDKPLVDFLQETGVITHFDNKGLPFYNEYYLCFDPEERLLINGHWQEGIVPDFGVSDDDRKQITRFFNLTTQLKNAKGNDGKYAFDIPLDNSSADETYRKLDRISFQDYLKQNGFTSPYLLWYLNYCCKDDYGTPALNVSAWAGLHYFSARKGTAANAEPNAVITWPEGNGWLMKQLKASVKDHIQTSSLAYDINIEGNGKVAVKVLDLKKNTSTVFYADKVIMASPQFVNQKLLKNIPRPGFDVSKLHYSPWLIANLTVNEIPTAVKGMVLCWDNVAYNTASVGYVNANQQDTKLIENKKVITYYLPLCDKEPRLARLAAYTRTYEQWMDIVITEMEQMHPGITEHIEQTDIWLWGHGMIAPTVDYIWGDNRRQANAAINNQIFFAHTDLSGISIFEEAFHHGIRAAQQVLDHGAA
ncbi:FAD-dependent oxidoreductase [Mucilaginibacter sp. CAU 1740]|uniref:FAD-dependent oxidoreductase n=1 Tax=Mucilaginibacter sp. CAU 1740 TaxID=3140365 RepID=UPI00325A6A20